VTRADKLLLVLVIAGLPFVYLVLWHSTAAGDMLVVWSPVTGKQEFNLHRDQVLKIQGRMGISRIDIRNGKARFTHSPCTGKLCIQHGWVSRGGDFVACLPNRVSVEVRTASEHFDAINY
jgi:hypothetical protein